MAGSSSSSSSSPAPAKQSNSKTRFVVTKVQESAKEKFAALNTFENGFEEKQGKIAIKRAFVIFSGALFCNSFWSEEKADEKCWCK